MIEENEVRKIIKLGLSIEQYFILYCIDNNNKKLLEDYIIRIGKFDKSNFDYLVEVGYLEPIIEDITFENIKLKQKYYDDFSVEKLDYDRMFKELLEVYPKRVGKRPLHNNLIDCKKKYKSIIKSEIMHQNVLKCVKMYIDGLKKSGKDEFTQLLSTFLNQRNYEQYMDEIEKSTNLDYKEDRL